MMMNNKNNDYLSLLFLTVSFILGGASLVECACGNYQPDWASLDSRPNPAWYNEVKFGIFIHWGVYSVPSFAPPTNVSEEWSEDENPYAEWYWHESLRNITPTYAFNLKNYGIDHPYQNFASDFRAELWEPNDWAKLFLDSGAKYVVLTSKHHEGFCLWPSSVSWNWNSVDIGPRRDIVGELSQAVRSVGLEMGLYYSLYEWYNPLYLSDPESYVQEIMLPQLRDIVNTYQPSVLWGDGCLDYPSYFWETPNFLSWLYNESPVCDKVVINDRWGNDTLWTHGGFFVAELGWPNPDTFHGHKWEECKGMAWSFGFNRMENSTHYWTPSMLINRLVWIVAKGGNFLLDVGPTADGRIIPTMQDNLLAMGAWLKVNGEAIYNTTPWRENNETTNTGVLVFYTYNSQAGSTVYAHCTKWPGSVLTLILPTPSPDTEITYLGLNAPPLKYSYSKEQGLQIEIPFLSIDQLPALYVYVLKITHVL